MPCRVLLGILPGLVLALAGLTASEVIRQRDLAAGWDLPGWWVSFCHNGYLWPTILGLSGGVLVVGFVQIRLVGFALMGGAVALLAGIVFADYGRGAAPAFSSGGGTLWPTPAVELFGRMGWGAALWLLFGAALGAGLGWVIQTGRRTIRCD